ncbi:alpha/beta hydrolase [Caulobacter sp. SLTY]|uniref:alpha/beta hydrolase n=1 Tax=Caulobacter sp. SLTY TaxID=2683262 RepID=UPI00196B4E30|nr:alpha/beta hydrolase [Caulobacter sp. SLTY]
MASRSPNRPLIKAAIVVALVLAAVWAAGVGYIYANQRRYLYYPDPRPQVIDPDGPAIQAVRLKTADGESLVGWWLPPEDGQPVFLFFPGNALGLSVYDWRYRLWSERGAGFLALGYRGFSGSTGKPSETGLTLDAETAYSWVAAHYPADRIVINGYSLGTGVAVRLATKRPARALVLEAPYTSTVDVARPHMLWAPVDLLMHDKFDSRSLIGEVRMPIMIVHGDRDQTIPFALGQALYEAAPQPKRFLRMEGVDHNGLTTDAEMNAIWSFIGADKPTISP